MGIGWKRWFAVPALSAAVALSGVAAPAQAAALAQPVEQLNEVFTLIEQYHISGITAEELRDAAIEGMIERLEDPYTVYYNEEEWAEMTNAFEQNYAGIGIQFYETDRGLQVLKVYSGSAAEEAGLAAGDIVVSVAGKRFAEYGFEELQEDLYGREGSQVTLGVVKSAGGSGSEVEVTVTRRMFHIPTVEYAFMDGGAGYIRIDSFSSDTAFLAAEALRSFAPKPTLTSLILDLRGNPGGYLDAVERLAEFFIGTGVLLRTVDGNGNEAAIEVEGERAVNIPVTILVDEYSASASEVFAGAMQDHELARIVGTRTFGKGSVQRLIALQNGGGLRVTVEHYFTPNGSQVNGVGIMPDVVKTRPLDQTLTAVRMSGIGQLRVELLPYETRVNGIPFFHTADVLRENGRVYVPALDLGAFIGGSVVWNGAKSSVTVRGMNISMEFTAANGLKLMEGTSYIDVARFSEAFPDVKTLVNSESVVLELK